MPEPIIGAPAPDFSLPATGNRTIRLADLRGQAVVLYFYPKDSTPGCTQEGLDFQALAGQFAALGAVILGVSRDSVASHEKFGARQGFTFDLLSDAQETACRAYDVIREKNMYGKTVLGIERSYLPDRRRRRAARGLAQGEGQGPRRGGTGAPEGALASAASTVPDCRAPATRKNRERGFAAR
jgi:Peroxiredoxin